MRSIKVRLNLVMGLVGVVTTLVTGWVLNVVLLDQAEKEIRRESLQQMATAQAVRSYTTEHIRNILLSDQKTFHAPAIPSFAAVTTMRYLQTTYPGYSYQEVALNPTNPKNQAHGWTKTVVDQFRSGQASETFFTTGEGAKRTFHYAKPITVSNQSCLTCHGQASAAPSVMLAKYGANNGFGWHVGEVVGAQIVSVPADAALSKARTTFAYYLAGASIVLLSLFGALNWMLSSILLKPMQHTQDALKKLAGEDSLTGAANRRNFTERLDLEMALASHHGGPLSLLMIDLDHFKRINDTFGHAAGDTVLKEVCKRVNHKIRRNDLLGRLGGEEFAVLLPQTDETGALSLASNLLRSVSETEFDGVGLVTASMGLGQWEPGEPASALFERVDAALYAAKHGGRNRVVRAKPRQ